MKATYLIPIHLLWVCTLWGCNNSNSDATNTLAQRPLNDTGITRGANYPEGINLDCDGESVVQQDCFHGRTALDDHLVKVGDGDAGFDFTKLGANGTPLAIQNQAYNASGSEAAGSKWSCVRDNHTGLTWEVKTQPQPTADLHAQEDTFNWYFTNTSLNGGNSGYADDDQAICSGYNSADSTTHCNTQAYTQRVNAIGLCGATDWRLPSVNELRSIVHFGKSNPTIDTHYFPNTASGYYWSAVPSAQDSDKAWVIHFSDGSSTYLPKKDNQYLRLVRSH